MRHLGEILAGGRTYFPLPVAYANDRSPIIPAELGARPLPIAAGMGNAFFEETSVTEAVAQPAALFGIPVAGLALVVGGIFLFSFAQGYYGSKSTRKRRVKP